MSESKTPNAFDYIINTSDRLHPDFVKQFDAAAMKSLVIEAFNEAAIELLGVVGSLYKAMTIHGYTSLPMFQRRKDLGFVVADSRQNHMASELGKISERYGTTYKFEGNQLVVSIGVSEMEWLLLGTVLTAHARRDLIPPFKSRFFHQKPDDEPESFSVGQLTAAFIRDQWMLHTTPKPIPDGACSI